MTMDAPPSEPRPDGHRSPSIELALALIVVPEREVAGEERDAKWQLRSSQLAAAPLPRLGAQRVARCGNQLLCALLTVMLLYAKSLM